MVTDTGCQSTAIFPAFTYRLGYRRKDFIKVASKMTGPSKIDLGVIGAVVVKFECKDAMGNTFSTKQLCYVCENIVSVYMSRQGCQELRLVDKDFPTPRPRATDTHHSLNSAEHMEQVCDCPARPDSPPPPYQDP